jgi:hypothetical protein
MPLRGSASLGIDRLFREWSVAEAIAAVIIVPTVGSPPVRKLEIHPHGRKDTMDKLVRRVTVVQGSGEHRDAKVVYETDEDEDLDDSPISFNRLERSVRHLLKAQVIAAQDAYQRHLDSTAKGGRSWVVDGPGNFMRAGRKGFKEARKAVPFDVPKVKVEDDEDEGD